MISIKYFFDRIRDVKSSDIVAIIPMTIALVVKPFLKKKYRNTWLVCEEPYEARDNGYHFFKYLCKEHPEIDSFYAIKRKSADYQKVEVIGKVIEYGSVKHWVIYFLCKYNISSQKGGKPNAALCSFMELNGRFHTCNVFLQHGIIINDLKWLYADKSKIDFFVTSTTPESDFVKSKFGYPEGVVQCTGLPRFDALHNIKLNQKQIVIMPTWRYWFNLNSQKHKDTDSYFETSEYVNKWMELLDSDRLGQLIKAYDLKIIFYLHRNLQRYDDIFQRVKNPVTISTWTDYDIQELLKLSVAMITDYSSVFFDMVYMKKAIIFYQFDEKKYRKYQYAQGYFDYHNNPFGKTFNNSDNVIDELEILTANQFKITVEYLAEHNRIFPFWDDKNCQRVYQNLCTYSRLD